MFIGYRQDLDCGWISAANSDPQSGQGNKLLALGNEQPVYIGPDNTQANANGLLCVNNIRMRSGTGNNYILTIAEEEEEPYAPILVITKQV